MIKEAEANAEADKKRREMVEVKNQAEGLIHSTEKSLKEYGDKVGEADRQAVENAITALKDALAKDDVELVKANTNDLMQASMKIGEAMYKAQQEARQGRRREGHGQGRRLQEGRRHRRRLQGSEGRQEEERLTLSGFTGRRLRGPWPPLSCLRRCPPLQGEGWGGVNAALHPETAVDPHPTSPLQGEEKRNPTVAPSARASAASGTSVGPGAGRLGAAVPVWIGSGCFDCATARWGRGLLRRAAMICGSALGRTFFLPSSVVSATPPGVSRP